MLSVADVPLEEEEVTGTASTRLKATLARNPKFDARGAEDAERLLEQAERGEP